LIQRKFLASNKGTPGSGAFCRGAVDTRPQSSMDSFIRNFARINTLLNPEVAANPFEMRDTGGVSLLQIQRTAGPVYDQEFADATVQGGRQCFGQLALY
jgi:hypothetical protein